MQIRNVKDEIERAIQKLREQYPDFEHSYDTYTQQYGSRAVAVNELFRLNHTTDPVVLVLGRNCALFYSDSKKELRGSEGKIDLKGGSICILGRRQPQDSKLIAWTTESEVELADYNSQAGIIPSRVHAVIYPVSETESYFTDLCSSSGTVLVGDSSSEGHFVKVYDPGTPNFPTIRIDRTPTNRTQ